jgi:hypothetical protein
MDLLLIVAGLAALGLAARRFGQDSRDLDGAGPWHSWRELALRTPVPADPLGVDVEATYRVEQLRATGARERLVRPAGRRSRSPAGAGYRSAVGWLGAALVRVGERLQSYGRTAPGW